jgi:hypothetical protein
MTEWLAVIVICLSGECAFWASVKEPIDSKQECEAIAKQTANYFEQNGVEVPLFTCLPIKWIKA